MIEIPIEFTKHQSAKSLIYSWYNLDKKDNLSTIVDLKQFTEKEEKGPVKEAIKIIKEKGEWAFCRPHDKKLNEIGFWVKPGYSIIKIIDMLAHELCHATGEEDEAIARQYGAIASIATYIASLRFKSRIKLHGDKSIEGL